jgi:hypothetical protein
MQSSEQCGFVLWTEKKPQSPFLARLRVWDERRVNLSGTGGLPDCGMGDTFPSQGKNHLGMMRNNKKLSQGKIIKGWCETINNWLILKPETSWLPLVCWQKIKFSKFFKWSHHILRVQARFFFFSRYRIPYQNLYPLLDTYRSKKNSLYFVVQQFFHKITCSSRQITIAWKC